MKTVIALTALILFTSPARGEYARVPEFKALNLWAGFDYFKSDGNFDSNASIVDINFQNDAAVLTDLITQIGGEYGIADRWAVGVDFSFISSTLDSLTGQGTLLTGSGLGDIITRLKWGVKWDVPVLTIEAMVRAPVATSTPATNGDIVLGNGSFDFGVILHSAVISEKFDFYVSPGAVFRSGGYSIQGTVDAAVQLKIGRAYFWAMTKFIYSITDTALKDSSLTVHDAPGSGGSFARLSGSPIGLDMGGKIGLRLSPKIALEGGGMFSIFGNKYPKYFQVGGRLVFNFDFYEKPNKLRTREIPLDMDYNKY